MYHLSYQERGAQPLALLPYFTDTTQRKEGNILFNDALNTFYLRLYGVRHMVKDHSDSERGNPLQQGFFYMHHPIDMIIHTTAFVTPVVEHWLEREIAQWVHPMKDRSDDPSHHEWTLLPQSYILLLPHWGACPAITNIQINIELTESAPSPLPPLNTISWVCTKLIYTYGTYIYASIAVGGTFLICF